MKVSDRMNTVDRIYQTIHFFSVQRLRYHRKWCNLTLFDTYKERPGHSFKAWVTCSNHVRLIDNGFLGKQLNLPSPDEPAC